MSTSKSVLAIVAGWALFVSFANAADGSASVAKCDSFVDVKSKSRQVFDSTVFLQVSGMLENQGANSFDVAYDVPKSLCEVESFDGAGSHITVFHSPWQKGDATLLYKVMAKSAQEQREILFVYDGIISRVAKEGCFHVSEKRNGVVYWYAIYKDQPTYTSLKDLVLGILDDQVKPLLAVKWSADGKELEQVVYDKGRLK